MRLLPRKPRKPATPGQCTATTTKTGARCKLPAVKGTDRCVLKAHQRVTR